MTKWILIDEVAGIDKETWDEVWRMWLEYEESAKQDEQEETE